MAKARKQKAAIVTDTPQIILQYHLILQDALEFKSLSYQNIFQTQSHYLTPIHAKTLFSLHLIGRIYRNTTTDQAYNRLLSHAYLQSKGADAVLTLYIGNKNYSSWSMRPWLVLKAFGIDFSEQKIMFDDFAADGAFKQQVKTISITGKVPLLVDGGFVIEDSLAIVEYLADTHRDTSMWPLDIQQRAQARSLCAHMHSGFLALREACPMNIEVDLPEVGHILWHNNAALRADVVLLEHLWSQHLQDGRAFLFGEFGIVDAFYAPVVMRLFSYHIPLNATCQAYADRVRQHPAVQEWIQDALSEHSFVPVDEPYRQNPYLQEPNQTN